MQWRPRVNILGWMPGYSDSNARAAGALYKAEADEATALTTKINEHGPLSTDSTDPREMREMAKPRYQDWARDYHEWSKDNPNSEEGQIPPPERGPAEPRTGRDPWEHQHFPEKEPKDQEIQGLPPSEETIAQDETHAKKDAKHKLTDDIRDSYDRPDREYDAPDNDEPSIEPAIGYRADWPRDAQTVIDQQAIEDSEEGWPGIRPGIRGAGVPGHVEQNGSDVGDRQDNTDATRKISLIDQIIGAAGDRMPAPGVEPGVHQTKGMEV